MALPPGKIQRIPRGLLSFLQVSTSAEYPVALANQLLPTMDLTNWYGAEGEHITGTGAAIGTVTGGTQLRITATAPNTTLSDGTSMTVPQNEIWLVSEWLVQCFHAAAGDFFDVSPAVYFHNVSSSRFYSPATALSGDPNINAANIWAHRAIMRPVLLAPGEEVAMLVNRALAAAGTPHTPVSRFKLLRFRA
jgi:hypothetical protein